MTAAAPSTSISWRSPRSLREQLSTPTPAVTDSPESSSPSNDVRTDRREGHYDGATTTLLTRLSRKWAVTVIGSLARARTELRFSQILHDTDGISSKMLCSTIRELVDDGLVLRREEPTSPPRVHYRLSTLGQSLAALLDDVQRWSELHMPWAITADPDAQKTSIREPEITMDNSHQGGRHRHVARELCS